MDCLLVLQSKKEKEGPPTFTSKSFKHMIRGILRSWIKESPRRHKNLTQQELAGTILNVLNILLLNSCRWIKGLMLLHQNNEKGQN